MNMTDSGHRQGAPHATTDPAGDTLDPQRLAPHVEQDWVDAFILEQRLLGIPGDRIGDALAEVESHVNDSGEGALDAFGDPVAYAREVAAGPRVDDDRDPSWIFGLGLGLAGMNLTLFSTHAWIDGEGRMALTAGHLVVLGLVVATLALLLLRSEAFLRFVLQRPWVSLGLFVLHFSAMVGALFLLSTPVAHVPTGLVGAAGVLALAAGTIMEWRSRTAGQLEDPILGPGESRPARGGLGWFGWLTILLFPLITLAMVGLSLLVARLS
ncbi:HAAS signaling domain-containing protein [Ornithinimicrobium sufpigmenti]|uniref:HAAS signaling domain-containing protein n=1 Tax=Ornithinimicrobium sufpigmenti TaxID=2508882 RepID=UPI00103586C2|nr:MULTISPECIES: hypothetical protein [unclassified Ornithinimicrobium]